MPPKKKVGFASDVTSTKVAATTAKKAAAATKASTAATAGKKKAAAPSRPGIVKAAEVAPVVAKPTKTTTKATAPAKAKKEEKGSKKGGKAATGAAYQALQLRHLPAVFQEPELRKFLSQFGTTVEACYVVRTKSNASRGTAYVTFAPKTTEGQYEAILDECHGMLLGGSTVMAKYVTLRRAMPNKKLVDARRKLDWLNKTRGRKLSQYNVTEAKSAFETLLRATAAERKANAALAKLGIAYQFHGFQQQYDGLSKDFIEAQRAAKRAAGEADDSDSDAPAAKKASPKGKAVQAADIEAIAERAVRAAAAKEATPVRGSPAVTDKKGSARKSAGPAESSPAAAAATPTRKSTGTAATPTVRTVQLTAETPKSASRRVDATPVAVKATPAAAKATPAATPASAKATPKAPSSAAKKTPARWR